jgi:Plasmid pRiA4b ORF-3-like protein
MGWSDMHLHNFRIHGKDYGITRPCGKIFSDLASEVKLATFGFREKEKFLYEYDFSISPVLGGAWRHWWRHQIRVEAIKILDISNNYQSLYTNSLQAANANI